MIVPNEAVAMKEIIYYWTPMQKVPAGVWITIFIFLPFAFNFLNVRRYGELEYWLTMIKIITLVTLFFLGVVFLPLGINEDGPLLATNGTEPVLCPTSIINNGTCLPRPGFSCICLWNVANRRLERRSIPRSHRNRSFRRPSLLLGVLLPCNIRLHRPRIFRHNRCGNRKSS